MPLELPCPKRRPSKGFVSISAFKMRGTCTGSFLLSDVLLHVRSKTTTGDFFSTHCLSKSEHASQCKCCNLYSIMCIFFSKTFKCIGMFSPYTIIYYLTSKKFVFVPLKNLTSLPVPQLHISVAVCVVREHENKS